MNTPGAIQTFTGQFVNVFDPDPDTIQIEDIAHALSQQCRFTGHTKRPWSVAQHSLLVAALVPPEAKLWALLHDATEAYLVDLPRPIKKRPEFAIYRQIESKLESAIAERFDLTLPIPTVVKQADNVALWAEAELFLHGTKEWIDERPDINLVDFDIDQTMKIAEALSMRSYLPHIVADEFMQLAIRFFLAETAHRIAS